VNNDTVGGRAADLLATYAYDWWMNTENLEADYVRQLDEFVRAYETRRGQAHAEALGRAKRTWQLTKPFADYAGRYTNDLRGTIEIAPRENALFVRMGKMNAVATPFIEKDTIRVEMEPGGNGEVIKFNKEADDRIVSLSYANSTFTRVP